MVLKTVLSLERAAILARHYSLFIIFRPLSLLHTLQFVPLPNNLKLYLLDKNLQKIRKYFHYPLVRWDIAHTSKGALRA
jgi:hypothetical protein